MAAKVSFDVNAKRIIINNGVTQLDTQIDLYSDSKEDWKSDTELNKFTFPFRVVGGDPLGGGVNAGAYFFLRNDLGWRIRPQEADHELTIDGNLFAEDSALPIFVPTLGDFTVTIRLNTSNLSLKPDSEWSATEKTDIINDVLTLKKIRSNRRKIQNNQMIIYDNDGITPLITFNLKDSSGNPSETNIMEIEPV